MAATDTSRRAVGGPRVERRARGSTAGSAPEARRLSHPARARARARFSKPKTTGTDLVVYRTPSEAPARTPIVERLTQLYYNVALALHRARHRPPKQRTAKII